MYNIIYYNHDLGMSILEHRNLRIRMVSGKPLMDKHCKHKMCTMDKMNLVLHELTSHD